jgi:hypothetical protein
MKLILRLVGYSETIDDDKYVYEMTFFSSEFNFSKLTEIFLKYLDILPIDELNNCTLTCNSKNLKKETIIDSYDTTYRLFIFNANTETKNKLIFIFKNYGEKILLNQQIITKTETSEYITSDGVSNNDLDSDNEVNTVSYSDLGNVSDNESDTESSNDSDKETDIKSVNELESDDEQTIVYDLEIFKDNDFIKLMEIYINKPELFKELYKYVNASLIKNNASIEENILTIKNLNLDFSEGDIVNALNLTNNHLNLAIRHLFIKS